jgi:hypothetical protein
LLIDQSLHGILHDDFALADSCGNVLSRDQGRPFVIGSSPFDKLPMERFTVKLQETGRQVLLLQVQSSYSLAAVCRPVLNDSANVVLVAHGQ